MPDREDVHADIRLRAVRDADIAVFFAHQREPAAVRMAAWSPWGREDFAAQWAELRADPAVDAQTILVDGAVAGSVTCWERDGVHEVGYWLGAAHWGRGTATTALALALCRCTVRPLHAFAAAHNAASLRVLEKCGFRRLPEADRTVVREGRDDDGRDCVTLLAHVLEF